MYVYTCELCLLKKNSKKKNIIISLNLKEKNIKYINGKGRECKMSNFLQVT